MLYDDFDKEIVNILNSKWRQGLLVNNDPEIDRFGLIRHTLVTWSEMGKQTLSSIERHIKCHISLL